MRTNYVLIDYENVQPDTLPVLDGEHFKVMVFVGANQTKLSFETAAALQRLGGRAEYIKISGNGPNALDFHIAYYVGALAAQDPTAYFHIVSKDGGFDPLILHLKSKKIFAERCRDVSDIPLVKVANHKSVAQRGEMIVADLQRRGAAKPRTLRTLSNAIHALFLKQLSAEELNALLAELQARGVVSVTGTTVAYSLPA